MSQNAQVMSIFCSRYLFYGGFCGFGVSGPKMAFLFVVRRVHIRKINDFVCFRRTNEP